MLEFFLRRCLSPDADPPAGDPPAGDPPAYVPPTIDMATALPPELREKPAFKGKDFVSLVKEHDNLQTLLGQRPQGIPKEDASDEEWGKFTSALKPKTPDEYALPETEFSKAKGRSEEYVKNAREILYNADVPKRQAGKIIAGFESMMAKLSEANEAAKVAEEAKRAAEFEALLDKTYTTNKQAVLDRTKKLMVDLVDPSMKAKVGEGLKNLPNDILFALTSIMEGVHTKYLSEDAPPNGGDGNGAATADSLQAEAEAIMKTEVYQKFQLPGHDAAKAKVQELFARVAAIRNAGKS